MKQSLKKTVRSSVITMAAFAGFSIPQASAAIFWPGAGVSDQDKNAEYQQGYEDGTKDCLQAPQPCGVKIYPMIKEQGYGETEPNDHIVNADGLISGQFYHANTLGKFDEDWYYVVTDKPSQKLSLYFLGDPQNFESTAGWIIQVRDLNGNIIASFDSTNTGSDPEPQEEPEPSPITNQSPVDSAKIVEVTLGKLGTYYISVKSKEDSGILRGYNIAARLEDTGQITSNPDESFFDSETESNDEIRDADPLRHNVIMTALFNRTLIKTIEVTTPSKTEYSYLYKLCDPTDADTIPNGGNCTCNITQDPVSPNNPNFSLEKICEPQPLTDQCDTDAYDTFVPNDPDSPLTPSDLNPGEYTYDVPGQTDPLLNAIFDADPAVPGVQIPPYDVAANGIGTDDDEFRLAPADACYAKATVTPAKTEWVGLFAYDTDVYVMHFEDGEQLRIQMCVRTDCQFDKVHLKINKGNVVLMDGPIEPGQTIDLGVALSGDYYFTFSAEEDGVIGDTGDIQYVELLGPYDFLVTKSGFKP